MRINPFYLIKFLLVAAVLCSPAMAQTEQPTRCMRSNIDQDKDGLIEICNLNQLNEIRFNLDGAAYTPEGRTVKITNGCPTTGSIIGCIGYELTRDLDFRERSDYRDTGEFRRIGRIWRDGGWQPIGGINVRDSGREILRGFSGVFEGNGYTISNLLINLENENIANRDATGWGLRGVGLFGFTTQTAVIRNIGLLNLKIQKNNSPQARPDNPVDNIYYLKGVGGLVGINGGKIINSYVSGEIDGGIFDANFEPNNKQGRDKVGGLVGTNLSEIVNSYAIATVRGSNIVGGLVGENCFNRTRTLSVILPTTPPQTVERFFSFHPGCPANSTGEIINSYARGIVQALGNGGGLVGANRSRITNSYADSDSIARVVPIVDDNLLRIDFGGLVAVNDRSQENTAALINQPVPIITASYWQNDGSSLNDIGRVGSQRSALSYTAGRSASDLKLPDDATGIYSSWNVADWDFGTTEQYPVLKYATDEDPSTCGKQPRRKDTDPPECGSLLPNQGTGLRDLDIAGAEWTPDFSSDQTDYTVSIDNSFQDISLRLNAYNPEANITIEDIGTAIGSTETTILLSQSTTLTVTVSDGDTDFNYNVRIEKQSFVLLEREIELQPENDISINADGTVNENSEITLSVVADGNYDYRWEQSPMWNQSQSPYPNAPSISTFIPLDFVDGDSASTTRSVIFTLTVSDGSDSLTLSRTLIVRNVPNETIGPLRVDIDADNDGLIEIYHLEDLDAIRYQMDGTGYRANATAARITTGCPNTGCNGYELARNLDFEDDASYFRRSNKALWTVENSDDDRGWLPIGDSPNAGRFFNSTFEGNGYTISNLQINRTASDNVGLFGLALQDINTPIKNLGLRDINIRGRESVGGLVGDCTSCLIVNSYATGTVNGHSHLGGLIGRTRTTTVANSHAMVNVSGSNDAGGFVGGLIGRCNQSDISNSYASGNVSGNVSVGGLVGYFFSSSQFGKIDNSYASGQVTGNSNVGGLIGANLGGTGITNSYASGDIRGSTFVGSFVGYNSPVLEERIEVNISIDDSYWAEKPDSPTNDLERHLGQSVEMLQSPTDASDIYANWSTTDWDFGNNRSYPVLRYGSSGTIDTCDFDPQTSLPQCGTLLPNQRDSGLSALFIVENGEISNNDLRFFTRPFSSLVYDYIVPTPSSNKFQIMPFAINGDNATITITESERVVDFFNNRSSGDISEEIELGDTRILTIEVTDGEIITRYMLIVPGFSLLISETLIVEPTNADGTVNEGSTITLRPIVAGGTEPYDHVWAHSLEDPSSLSELTTSTLSFRVPENFVGTDDTRDVVFTVRVNDNDGSSSSRTTVLRVNRIDNGPPNADIETEITSTTITIRVNTGEDPDGDGGFTYQWQERKLGIDWVDISTSTDALVIPQDTPGSTRYRVIVTHIDAQNHISMTQIDSIRVRVDDDGDNLIEIYYLEDLDAIRHQLDGKAYNTGSETARVILGCEADTCGGYELGRDLDFRKTEHYSDRTNMNQWIPNEDRSNEGWQRIGVGASGLATTFEGNDLTISNLFINRPSESAVALFGQLARDGKIQNVGLLDIDVQGLSSVGGLVANNAGLILNSHVGGLAQVSGNNSIGGLVGWNVNGGRIINSYADAEIIGIVGALGPSQLGGLVGFNQGVINDSYAMGDITGEDNGNVGGLVGVNEQLVTNSFATGNISGRLNAGGLIGFNDDPPSNNLTPRVANSFATGNVQGSRDDSQNLGGLIGRNIRTGAGAVRNTYSNGVVSGHANLGGLIGFAENSLLQFSYTTSLVMGTSSTSVGGLIGNGSGGSVTASYWQNDDSELPDVARGNVTINGSAGRSATELKAPETNTGIYSQWSTDDWDFGTRDEYPILGYGKGIRPIGDPQCADDPNTELLPDCALILDGQQPTLVALELEQTNSTSNVIIYRSLTLDPEFDPEVLEYEAEFNAGTTRIRLTPVANHSSNTISYKIGTQDFQELTGNASFIHILMNNEDSLTVVIRVSPHSRSSTRGTKEYTIELDKSQVRSLLVRTRLFLEGPAR